MKNVPLFQIRYKSILCEEDSDPTLTRGFRGFQKLGSAERDGYEIVNFDLTSLAI
jgi:hypothetical protein